MPTLLEGFKNFSSLQWRICCKVYIAQTPLILRVYFCGYVCRPEKLVFSR